MSAVPLSCFDVDDVRRLSEPPPTQLPTSPVIDSHQHVWDLQRGPYDWLGPEMSPIDVTMTEEEVLPQLREVGVDAVVLVQAAATAWMTVGWQPPWQLPSLTGVKLQMPEGGRDVAGAAPPDRHLFYAMCLPLDRSGVGFPARWPSV